MAKKTTSKVHRKKHKLPKKPKKPKASASVRSWEHYDIKYRKWEARVREIHNEARRKEALIRKHRNT